ncbi:MAG: type III-B CRISPR module RAMP protein Cmr6 [Thermodesulfobacteria bacterium]|nr:type III-B CRISPR module RAMP protein Cmr6 [Thermodesulfobacteriota bacterium]
MASQACRDVLHNTNLDENDNAGLVLDRFLKVPYKDDGHPQARKELFEAAVKGLSSSKELYKLAFNRFREMVKTTPGFVDCFLKTKGRLIVGLSSSNCLETGVTLHHCYGTPIIPGSALKGLASHYCHNVWGEKEPRFREGQSYHETLFGTTDDSGHITFYDAWMIPGSIGHSEYGLLQDVMTPHHGEYYSDSGKAPTDFDDPNPISFLSVRGTFLFVVACDATDDEGKKWATLAMTLLTQALVNWGVGGKTNAGYGRFELENRGNSAVSLLTDEQIRSMVEDMSPKQIRKAFVADWNKTQASYGERLQVFIQAVRDIHGQEIEKKWGNSENKKDKRMIRRIFNEH